MGTHLGRGNKDDFDQAYHEAHRRGLVCEVITQRADETSKGGWSNERHVLNDWGEIIALLDQLRSDAQHERLRVSLAVYVSRFEP